MSNIYVMIFATSHVHPAMWLGSHSSHVAKTLTYNTELRLSTNFFFIPAMLLGTNDFYHFTFFFPSDLDLGWGHMVSGKQNLLASFSHELINWCSVEAVQVENPDTTLGWDFMNQGGKKLQTA